MSTSCSVMSNSLQPPWTVAQQAPLSMEFFRQEYWSGLPFPSPGDLLDPGVELVSLASPVLAGRFFTTEPQISYPNWIPGKRLVFTPGIPMAYRVQHVEMMLLKHLDRKNKPQGFTLNRIMSIYSFIPWGCKELDMTEWLSLSLIYSFNKYRQGSKEVWGIK